MTRPISPRRLKARQVQLADAAYAMDLRRMDAEVGSPCRDADLYARRYIARTLRRDREIGWGLIVPLP
jgi:hypothetical protein